MSKHLLALLAAATLTVGSLNAAEAVVAQAAAPAAQQCAPKPKRECKPKATECKAETKDCGHRRSCFANCAEAEEVARCRQENYNARHKDGDVEYVVRRQESDSCPFKVVRHEVQKPAHMAPTCAK